MEKKVLGIILATLGILGLMAAVFFMNSTGSSSHVHLIITGGLLGAILFFTGIWLIPSTAAYHKTMKSAFNKTVKAPSNRVPQL